MIVITSKREGFRRCGVAHAARPVEWPDGRWTGDELGALLAEPMFRWSWSRIRPRWSRMMEFDAAPLTGADAGAETAPADAEADPAGAGAMPVAKKTGRKK